MTNSPINDEFSFLIYFMLHWKKIAVLFKNKSGIQKHMNAIKCWELHIYLPTSNLLMRA